MGHGCWGKEQQYGYIFKYTINYLSMVNISAQQNLPNPGILQINPSK